MPDDLAVTVDDGARRADQRVQARGGFRPRAHVRNSLEARIPWTNGLAVDDPANAYGCRPVSRGAAARAARPQA